MQSFRLIVRTSADVTEEEIYEGCRRGDATARRELYTCFSGTMLAIGIRYLADRDEAEDLLHDVFVNVPTNFHKFSYKGEGSLRAWMKRVMVNAALDRLRRNKHAESTDIESVGDIPGEEPDTCRLPAAEILRMVASLPHGYRTVLNMYAFDGYSHKEIAARLGINEKSSSSQLSRAKSMLTKMINDYLRRNDEI